jgi:hypothetical protein
VDNPGAPSISTEDRHDAFVPVQGGAETTSAAQMLVIAYALMWLFALLFVYMTWRRQNALDRRLSGLEKALADRIADEKTNES